MKLHTYLCRQHLTAQNATAATPTAAAQLTTTAHLPALPRIGAAVAASSRRRISGPVHLRHDCPQVAVQIISIWLPAHHRGAACCGGDGCLLLPLVA